MSALEILFAIVTALAAGAGLTLLVWRKPEAILAAELFGCSWFLGTGVISGALAIGGMVLPGRVLQCATLLGCALLFWLGWRRLRSGIPVATGLAGVSGWERWAWVLAVLPALYMAHNTYRDAISWDGLFIWESKARFAFLSGGSLPASYFSDTTRIGDHPNYPLFLPMTELWVYLWRGDCDQTAIKPLFPIFYAAAAALLWSSAFRLSGRQWIAALTVFVPLFVPLMADHGLGLMQGYADYILGSAYLAGVGGLLAWRLKEFQSGWIIGCLFGALLPWIKQEGYLLLGSLLLQAAVIHGWKRKRSFLLFSLPGISVLAAWKLAMQCVHVVQKTDFVPVTMASLSANLWRVPQILYFMGVQLSMISKWSLLWFLAPLALCCLAWQRRREALPLTAAILVPLSLYVVPYIFTQLEFVYHMANSMDRLILQVSPVAVLAVGLALQAPREPAKPA